MPSYIEDEALPCLGFGKDDNDSIFLERVFLHAAANHNNAFAINSKRLARV